MQTTPVSVSINPKTTTAKKIVWNVKPIVAPLFLSTLTVNLNQGVQTNCVVGEIHPGLSTTQPGQCTLLAGPNKFAALFVDCTAAGLSKSLTYDDSFDVCDLTPPFLNAGLALEITAERTAVASEMLVGKVQALHETNDRILATLRVVSDHLLKRSTPPGGYGFNEEDEVLDVNEQPVILNEQPVALEHPVGKTGT